MSATANASKVNVDFHVKFGKETISLTLPLTATLADVKAQLALKTQVTPGKQRLLLSAPVDKDKRRDASDSCPLQELFPSAFLSRILTHAGSPTTTVPQHIKVTAMLIGSSHSEPMVDSKATTEISRLVTTTVEHGGQWYRCSFGKGYLRQTAYVCRTCIAEGRADPDHAVCLACAEMCHGNHEVEEWGVRYCMRCDCCTKKCWRTPPEGYTRMPRLNDPDPATSASQEGAPGAQEVSTVAVMTSSDVSSRFEQKRKRSRSSSPMTPKRVTTGSGGSPVSGVRVAAVANAPSPFALQDPPPCETLAVTSPVAGNATEAAALRPGAPSDAQSAFPQAPESAASAPKASPGDTPQRTSQHTNEEEAEPATADGEAAVYKPLPEVDRCMFIIDGQTGKPPVTAVLPANSRNRYPRNPLKWCYCEDDHPSDDPDCGGIVCILCATCFWSDHMQRLHSEAFRRVPCYGDVVQGDTLAFKCVDCNTYVCAPCRLRCHRHHTVEPELINPSREDGTDNGAPVGVNFSCGCRGLCSIAEAVPAEELDDPATYLPMPPEVATALMDNDVFTGFLCAHCMQEYPWLVTNSPTHCYHGELPPKVTGSAIKPIVKCGRKDAPLDSEGVFPWHGMIVPVTAFSEEATCSCAPCRAAYDKFAPRASEDATEMIVQLHDECDNCGVSLKDQTAFMCQTCEMSMDKAFMICRACNELRLRLVQAKRQRDQSSNATTSAAEGQPPQAQQPVTVEGQTKPYQHSLDHEFLEDTYENVYALAGMQMMQTMDAESLEYLQSNWDSVKDHIEVTNTLVDTFGQIPLTFTDEELEAMAEENKRATSSSPGATHSDRKKADDGAEGTREAKRGKQEE